MQEYDNHSTLLEKICAFFLYFKIVKLSHLLLLTGTVLNILGPEYITNYIV